MMQEENTTGLPSEMPAGKETLRSERDPQEDGVRGKQACKRKHVEGMKMMCFRTRGHLRVRNGG